MELLNFVLGKQAKGHCLVIKIVVHTFGCALKSLGVGSPLSFLAVKSEYLILGLGIDSLLKISNAGKFGITNLVCCPSDYKMCLAIYLTEEKIP